MSQGAALLSAKGAAFIGRFEGFRPEPYNDPVGHATIGYGHLLHRGRVTPADRRRWGRITRARGLALLREDAARFESRVGQLVTVRLTQPQFDALVSLAFNIGTGPQGFYGSTVLRELNREHRRAAADAFLLWNKADGHVLAGLTRRRKEERRLFLTGRYVPGNAHDVPPSVRPAGPSPSFTWIEVHKGRTPFPQTARARVVVHAHKMEKLRDGVNALRVRRGLPKTGINILSWFRPRWYNEQIHGAPDSRHMYGDACDISLPEIERLCPWPSGNRDFDALCDRLFANGGFGQYPAGGRHVDSRGRRARWTGF